MRSGRTLLDFVGELASSEEKLEKLAESHESIGTRRRLWTFVTDEAQNERQGQYSG